MSPIVIVVIVVLITGLLIGVGLFIVRRMMIQGLESAQQRFPNARLIVPGAHFFGQQSAGVTQMRGNGTLVLADTELYFEKLVPRREYRIPYAAIQAVETPNSFLGKTNFRPLVKVVYRTENGGTDSMAWSVMDTEHLRQAIEDARR
jgi:hypothetical protein